MFENLRVVILDFPKKQLAREGVRQILADMLITRQLSYHRTIESYILMDKNDMISTHLMIYDMSVLHAPKILSGIRLIHSDRCRQYGLPLPIEENLKAATLPTQNFFENFKKRQDNIIECAGWYVDSDFSYAKTKLDLAQILFFSLTTYLLRNGITHFTGATNEKYKASRWVEKAGSFEEGHIFPHPTIKDPHKLTVVEQFNHNWLIDCFAKYGDLLSGRLELLPEDAPKLLSIDEIKDQILRKSKVA